MHIVILAGGGGIRLWPLSRQDFPKQFLRFGDQNTLLQRSVRRFLDSPLTETISVATNVQYAPLVKEQLSQIDPDQRVQIIVEPGRKNTAPAIAFAVKYLQKTLGVSEDASILILPSDHLIEPQSVFSDHLEQIDPLIKNHQLILFGIQPTKPETGYGYIQIGAPFNRLTHHVKQFIEKPDKICAERYLASGDYFWNAGMFAFSMARFWKTMQEFAPQITALLTGSVEEASSRFQEMPDISFDYAVLEKCSDLLLCPLPVLWSDVGSWDSVYDVMDKDADQNVKFGNVVSIDTKNSLILGGKRLISTIGLDDLLIVETEDATFISKKGQSQKVKPMVQQFLKGRKEIHRAGQKKYQAEKIAIEGGQKWQKSFSQAGLLILLSGEVFLDKKAMAVCDPISIELGRSIEMNNLSDKPAELLLLSGNSIE